MDSDCTGGSSTVFLSMLSSFQPLHRTHNAPRPITAAIATFTCSRIWTFQIIPMGKVASMRSVMRLKAVRKSEHIIDGPKIAYNY